MNELEIEEYQDWKVILYRESEYFFTECKSPEGIILRTEACDDKRTAWRLSYNLVDVEVKKAKSRKYVAIAKPLTLMLLYVMGNDEYYLDRFTGRRAYKGHDFGILDIFEAEGLIELETNKKAIKSVVLSDEGIKQARELLRNLNINAGREFLDAVDEI